MAREVPAVERSGRTTALKAGPPPNFPQQNAH